MNKFHIVYTLYYKGSIIYKSINGSGVGCWGRPYIDMESFPLYVHHDISQASLAENHFPNNCDFAPLPRAKKGIFQCIICAQKALISPREMYFFLEGLYSYDCAAWLAGPIKYILETEISNGESSIQIKSTKLSSHVFV